MASRDPDVLVIGAGVIGTAVAFELAEAGAKVRLLEAGSPGVGASRASAGILAPYLEGHDSPVLRALGRRSLDMYEPYLARVTARADMPVEFDRRGTLEIAVTEADEARLTASHSALAKEKIGAKWLDAKALAKIEPGLRKDVRGGLLVPLHALVNVPALTAAQAEAARKRGVKITTGIAATKLTEDGNVAQVYTAEGILRADHIVLAAGTQSPGLTVGGSDPLPVKPVRGQLLQLMAREGTVTHILWAPGVYLVPWRSGVVLVGATTEHVGFDDRATAEGVAGLLAAAIELVPALRTATFQQAKSGLRPGSPDELPFIGRSDVVRNLVYATGHYRNGALLAPLTATLVAGLVKGDTSDPALKAFDPMRVGRL